jgi:hypothetical protein
VPQLWVFSPAAGLEWLPRRPPIFWIPPRLDMGATPAAPIRARPTHPPQRTPRRADETQPGLGAVVATVGAGVAAAGAGCVTERNTLWLLDRSSGGRFVALAGTAAIPAWQLRVPLRYYVCAVRRAY